MGASVTPHGQAHALRLTLTDLPAGTVLASLTRSDVNGTSPCRPPAEGFVVTAGRLDYIDTEHALSGRVTYTALVRLLGGTTTIDTASVDVTGLWSTSRLAPVLLPLLGTTIDLVETYDATSPTASELRDVIDRPDPLVNLGIQRTRRGTLRIWARDYAHAREILRTSGRRQILQWRQPDYPGMDMYFLPGDCTVQPYEEITPTRRWNVLMPFTEVASPVGNVLGTAAWNFEASADRNATFFASLTEFPTFLDLTIGPGKNV